MTNETELRELLDDLYFLMEESYPEGPSVANAFVHGMAAGIAHALNLDVEKCGNPACQENHRRARIEATAQMRAKVQRLRKAKNAQRN